MNIVLRGIDGSVAIMTLAEGADKLDAIQKFRDSHQKGFYPDYYETSPELPLDREFRDAWTFKGNKVIIDDNKAKDIHLGRIRHVRNTLLETLDKEQLKNLSNSAKLIEIEDKKQILRDLPSKWNTLQWPTNVLGER